MKATPTTESTVPRSQTDSRRNTLGLSFFAPLLVALAALLPRAIGLRDFLTTDEAYHWISRSERFAAAVAEGRWADTILTGHPGVSLMWLGSLGLRIEQTAIAAGLNAPANQLDHLAWMRLGPVLAHTLFLSLGFVMLRRLLRSDIALVAALLWATSPYLVAHGRLLHLDALLTDLCMLTILALLVACQSERRLPWLIGSGAIAGLALLTKGPALILLPFVGLTLFGFALAQNLEGGFQRKLPRLANVILRSIFQALGSYFIWLAVAALVVFALWPALWVTPDRALGAYIGELVDNGGRPNGDGQFFLGQANADPGPFFYLIAGIYRLTPLELVGLLALSLLAIPGLRKLASGKRATLLTLAAFVIFWTVVMSNGPKKFDRYTLPTWPALLTLAAVGIDILFNGIAQRVKNSLQQSRTFFLFPFSFFILLFQGTTLALYHPYYLSYYDPLLGGGRAAQQMFLIGWGEGMDQVGEWLAERPDIGSGQVLSALPPTLQPFLPVPVQSVEALDTVPANYAVVYLESIQRQADPARYGRIESTLPLHTVNIHGIEYARIYQLPRPYATPVNAELGGAVRLLGYSLAQEGARLIVTPAWDVRTPLGADYMLFLHIYDSAGQRVAQIDVPPGGSSAPPTSQWQPGEQIGVPLPIDLPAGLAAGDYHLILGLYDPAGTRLPVTNGSTADPAIAGPDAVDLGTAALGAP